MSRDRNSRLKRRVEGSLLRRRLGVMMSTQDETTVQRRVREDGQGKEGPDQQGEEGHDA